MGGRTIFACACALVLLAPPAAGAQDRPDPNSPAGVEYELPLEGARRDASGDATGHSTAGKAKASPLFGEGISKSKPVEVSEGKRGSAGPPAAKRRAKRSAPPVAKTARPPETARLAARAGNEGGDTGLLLTGIAAAVLIGGALLGLGLRRGFGRS